MWHRHWLGGRCDQRSAVHGVAGAVGMHPARIAAAAVAVALGGDGRSVYPADRTGCLCDSHGEADARAGVWILPGISSGIAGAYGGSIMRGVMDNLRQGK